MAMGEAGSDHDRAQGRMEASRSEMRDMLMRIAALGNLSAGYNLVDVNLVIVLIQHMDPDAISARNKAAIAVSSLVGSILGQLSFGRVGDVFGLTTGMKVAMLCIAAGAIGSSISAPLAGMSLHTVISVWRFILGLGVGGVYPLAAGMAQRAGQQPKNGRADKGKKGAVVFAFFGVGMAIAPAVFLILLACGASDPVAWRTALLLGAFPPIVLIRWLFQFGRLEASAQALVEAQRDTADAETGTHAEGADASAAAPSASPLPESGPDGLARHGAPGQGLAGIREALRRPGMCRKLGGTCLSWYLFDVTFYGNALFAPTVLQAVFGEADTPMDVASQTLLISLVALPGFALAAMFMDQLGPKHIQIQGFAVCAALYFMLGATLDVLQKSHAMLLIVYAATFLFSSFGAKSTTYILPAYTFPPEVRSTLNGVSAAAGKVGAVMGGALFVPLWEAAGLEAVMYVCSFVSIIGVVVTVTMVERMPGNRSLAMQDEKAELRSGAAPDSSKPQSAVTTSYTA